jgi:hypothetical protein
MRTSIQVEMGTLFTKPNLKINNAENGGPGL